MLGWGAAVGGLMSIIDKCVPGRKEKLRLDLERLEQELKIALVNNDDMKAAQVRARMAELRKRVGETQ